MVKPILVFCTPSTDSDGWACCVNSSGVVYDVNYGIYNSYGLSPDTYLDWNSEVAYFIGSSGSLGGFSNGVWDSYGRNSPYTNYTDRAYYVRPPGSVDYIDDISYISYGRKNRRICLI